MLGSASRLLHLSILELTRVPPVEMQGMSSKGGLGKFTRRRRWTRKAVCTETVQLVSLPSLTVVVEEDKATATAAGAALRKRGDGARQASEHL